ncbi:hypothetical protein LOTGIDRAFT_217219 [Lottia gigantea]|uniref:Prefoldin subunit 5 n=1 Tax=Lottia gigantea TaxID=225164 RepID=V4A5T3_LOTGI|nr:hypothetical protein LOTGIDRAFT_217219 [Lottia gigantea]ESO92077.1 hypothetical protein LOTGIDRAFT_217219 [Lottia gigantea]
MAAKSPQQIDISQLPIQQLNQLAQQVEQELEFFQTSLTQLKIAQGKFVESQECMNKVTKENVDKEILVPLTSSMYVPGQLSNADNVLIEIGTGYYIEMSVDKGKDYFKRKVEYISKQMEKIQPILQEKYKAKQAIVEILQLKVQAQIAAQGQSPPAKA